MQVPKSANTSVAGVPFLEVPSFWAQGKWPWLFMLVSLQQMVGNATTEREWEVRGLLAPR
jgi:hypothetical protein